MEALNRDFGHTYSAETQTVAGAASGSQPNYLFVGGLVAMDFDATGKFLHTISHSGLGVFAVGTWDRAARYTELACPDAGKAVGIGPLDGQMIEVQERDERREQISMKSPDGRFQLLGDSEGITIAEPGLRFPRYGTDFRAISANTFTATSGSAAVVTKYRFIIRDFFAFCEEVL